MHVVYSIDQQLIYQTYLKIVTILHRIESNLSSSEVHVIFLFA